MSTPLTPTPRTSALPAWLVPAGLATLAVLGLALVSAHWSAPGDAPSESAAAASGTRRVPPPPPVEGDPNGLHSVTTTVEHGARVVRIQTVPGGDEMVVDAETGKLLETRPSPAASAPIRPGLLAP